MKILALEFSSDQRSVAIAEEENGTVQILASASETGGRSTRAFALIQKVLTEAKLERDALAGIAVGIGPGSYTGIRAAIAVAQGWQLATGLPCFAISSIAALALIAQQTGIYGEVAIVVDAQRGDFYVASYEISNTRLNIKEELRIVPAPEISARASHGEKIIGPDAQSFSGGQVLLPSAESIARLAFGTSPTPAEMLEPIYLRETSFIKAPPPRMVS